MTKESNVLKVNKQLFLYFNRLQNKDENYFAEKVREILPKEIREYVIPVVNWYAEINIPGIETIFVVKKYEDREFKFCFHDNEYFDLEELFVRILQFKKLEIIEGGE